MKAYTLSLIAAVSTLVFSVQAEAKNRTRTFVDDDQYVASSYTPKGRLSLRSVEETHDSIRAQAADPTHQYDWPDWARASFSGRGRR